MKEIEVVDVDEQPRFTGFVRPTSNYFRMPNIWTDITAEIDSLAELKVVEYVLRHTWGFHEFGQPKAISIDEFMHGRRRADKSRMDKGTKLSRPSVIDGLKRAVNHGYLICVTDDSDPARITKSYALNMQDSQEDVKMLNASKDSLPPTQSSKFTPPVKNLNRVRAGASQASLPRSEKETLERHSQKERESGLPDGPEEQMPDSSFSLSFSQDQSEEEELSTVFAQRWCVLTKVRIESLTDRDWQDIAVLAPKITTTEALFLFYTWVYERLKAFAASQGRKATPPKLYNLVKCLSEWEQEQEQKQQEKEREQKTSGRAVAGTGQVQNWTEARLRGEAPPVVYTRLEPRQPNKPSKSMSRAGDSFSDIREKLHR